MAKQVVSQKRFGFVAGLNTEAGYLTTPENTWREGQNVIPQINGELHRRVAIDVENGYTLTPTIPLTSKNNLAFALGEWNNVNGNGNLNFAVAQVGSIIYFYPNSGSSLSPALLPFTIDLATYKVANPNIVGYSPISCASGNGKLVVTSQDTTPLLVAYDEVLNTITVTPITLSIRDLQGVQDGLAMDSKPATLSTLHKYNLLNQGWTATQWQAYFDANNVYPSNAQTWTQGKDSASEFQPALLDTVDFGTSPAAKGRYVMNVFKRDRSALSGVAGIPVETESYRPTTVAFFAGRAFYAGVISSTIGNWIMFSQVAESDNKWGSCYQQADPTSEVLFDLIDTDGGVIPIQDAGTIVKLMAMQNSLFIFATNGVWQLGAQDTGFSATGYSLKKISNIGCAGANTVVSVESTVLYMSTSGIYAVSPDQTGMAYVVTPMTDLTIKTEILNIPTLGKSHCSAVYHDEEKKVFWLYNNKSTQNGLTDRYVKDTLLVLDTRLKSFYTLTIGELAVGSPLVADFILTKGRAVTDNTFRVVDNGGLNPIVDGAVTLNPLVADGAYIAGLNRTLKFLTIVPSGVNFGCTFADFDRATTRQNSARFADWLAIDGVGVEPTAFILTGYDLMGDNADKKKQPLYISVFSRATETGFDANFIVQNPSSILMQSQWEWTNSSAAGKWSGQYEVYRHLIDFVPTAITDTPSMGRPVIVTKNKVRGQGKSLSLLFTAGAGKDMKLIGWETTYIGNANV